MNKGLATKFVPFFFLICAMSLVTSGQGPNPRHGKDSAVAQLVGAWRGNSVCLAADSPCQNESNVYHISEIMGKPGICSVIGSKIVDGKEVVMGTGEWKYDPQKHLLGAETPAGTFRFTVDGNKMEGSLTLRDNTVYRRIYLTKEK
jgi:hypothetical protein